LSLPILTFPTKVPSDSLGWIGSLKRTSDKSLFPMALGSCGHRITHQLRPINMNGRSILAVTSIFVFGYLISNFVHHVRAIIWKVALRTVLSPSCDHPAGDRCHRSRHTSMASPGRRKGPPTSPWSQTVHGPFRARASGQLLGGGERGEKFDLSETVARFGDIVNRGRPIAEIRPRSFFVNLAVGRWQ